MRTVIGRYAKWFALFGLVLLTGCIGPDKALQNGYVDFDKAYADASNKQLLLNLARLANDDPVQFIQLGSFSAQYQYTYGGSLNSSYSLAMPEKYLAGQTTTTGSTPPTGGNTATYSYSTVSNPLLVGGSLNGGVTETPIFQYFPLTGTNLVEDVLAPISDKVFLTFYDQGYPADLVARTMVASVQHVIGTITNYVTNNEAIIPAAALRFDTNYIVDIGTNNSSTTYTITTNIVPSIGAEYTQKVTPKIITNYEYFVNSPGDRSYAKFLIFCDQLKDAQKYHTLTVGQKPGDEKLVYQGTSSLTDIVAAIQANLAVKFDTNTHQITVTQPPKAPTFIENTNIHPYPYPIRKYTVRTNNVVEEQVSGIDESDLHLTENIGTDISLPDNSVANISLATGGVSSVTLVVNDSPKVWRVGDGITTVQVSNAIETNLWLTEGGFSIEASKLEWFTNAENFAVGFNNNFTLKMRTVEAAMYTVAQEEPRYRFYWTNTVPRSCDCFLKQHTNQSVFAKYSYQTNVGPPEIVPQYITNYFTNSSLTNCVVVTNSAVKILNLTNDGADHLTTTFQVTDISYATKFLVTNYLSMRSVTEYDKTNYEMKILTNPPVEYYSDNNYSADTLVARTNIIFCGDTNGPYVFLIRPNFAPIIVRPLMRLTVGAGENLPDYVLTKTEYSDLTRSDDSTNQTYYVGDLKGEDQNRTVFTMLSYLFAQAAISTQNLPVQQLIQVP